MRKLVGLGCNVSGIAAYNVGSIRLHERFGFEINGHLHQVGRKFDRWLELVLMQRFSPAKGRL
jgi:L-amino acid N-acyltransferase YncA